MIFDKGKALLLPSFNKSLPNYFYSSKNNKLIYDHNTSSFILLHLVMDPSTSSASNLANGIGLKSTLSEL